MAKISNKGIYPQNPSPTLVDYLIGTKNNDKRTRNFSLLSIIDLINGSNGVSNIQFQFSNGADPTKNFTTKGQFFSDTNSGDIYNLQYLIFNKQTISETDISILFNKIGNIDSMVLTLQNPSDVNNVIKLKIISFENNISHFKIGVQPNNDFVVGDLENEVVYGLYFDVSKNSGSNKFTQLGTSLLTGNILTISTGYSWIIDSSNYENEVEYNFNIPFAATGKSRIDVIIATQFNTFEIIYGTESTFNALIPLIPSNTLQTTFLVVKDNGVQAPTPPVLGENYIEKFEKLEFELNGVFSVDGSVDCDIDDKRASVNIGIGITQVNGVEIKDPIDYYDGKKYAFKNSTDANVNLVHEGIPLVKFNFPNGIDYKLKPNEIAEFILRKRYVFGGSPRAYKLTLEYVGSIYTNKVGLVTIRDIDNQIFGNIQGARDYLVQFTDISVIKDESYSEGVYRFTVPRFSIIGSGFINGSLEFKDPYGLFTTFGNDSFISSQGDNVIGDGATFGDACFQTSTGDNVIGYNVNLGGNFFVQSQPKTKNIIKSISTGQGSAFNSYVGRLDILQDIGITPLQNMGSFTTLQNLKLHVNNSKKTNNNGEMDADLLAMRGAGASIFYEEEKTDIKTVTRTVSDASFTTKDINGFVNYINTNNNVFIEKFEIAQWLISTSGRIYQLKIRDRFIGINNPIVANNVVELTSFLNKDLQFNQYPNTRNDGQLPSNRVFSTDEFGNVMLYTTAVAQAPHLRQVSPSTALPNTTLTITILGSFFTTDMEVLIAGQTVNYITFITSNEIEVNITTGASESLFGLTLNNGLISTYQNVFNVVLGTVFKPIQSEWSGISGLNVSETGNAKITVFNDLSYGLWDKQFDYTKDFRVYFNIKKTPLGYNNITNEQGFVHLSLNKVSNSAQVINFNITKLDNNFPAVVARVSNNNDAPFTDVATNNTGTSLNNFDKMALNLYEIRHVGSIFYFYVNNVFAYQFTATTAENLRLKINLKTWDIVNIKYVEIA